MVCRFINMIQSGCDLGHDGPIQIKPNYLKIWLEEHQGTQETPQKGITSVIASCASAQ